MGKGGRYACCLDRGDAFMDSVTADREGIRLNLWTPGADGGPRSATPPLIPAGT
jgi:hypothetical protein